jgi:hypothetical protein
MSLPKRRQAMPAWAWVLIVIGVIAVAAIAWIVMSRRRTARLRERFGPEYNRVASSTDRKHDAEQELIRREERRESFELQPLSDAARDGYVSEWKSVQADFVDEPESAVARADSLLQRVMADRGYPVEKFDQRAADLSVDHPSVVENYREGHRLATEGDGTEDLRQAMRHYRKLFDELVDSGAGREREIEEARS